MKYHNKTYLCPEMGTVNLFLPWIEIVSPSTNQPSTHTSSNVAGQQGCGAQKIGDLLIFCMTAAPEAYSPVAIKQESIPAPNRAMPLQRSGDDFGGQPSWTEEARLRCSTKRRVISYHSDYAGLIGKEVHQYIASNNLRLMSDKRF